MTNRMPLADLKAFLEEKFDQFNRPSFVESDPISIPHLFSRKEDIEIAGFLTSLITWGKRIATIRAAHKWMERMDHAPFDFVQNASETELSQMDGFVYRTFNDLDARFIILGLRHIYREKGGLELLMKPAETAKDTLQSIMQLRGAFGEIQGFPQRTFKHLANPEAGSSAKRLNMYLRWMVRSDRRGVDLGIWQMWRPAQLICPLDVHSGNVARALGLLNRSQNDWRAATELTSALREMDAEDPVKYDFSLFGLGVFEGFVK